MKDDFRVFPQFENHQFTLIPPVELPYLWSLNYKHLQHLLECEDGNSGCINDSPERPKAAKALSAVSTLKTNPNITHVHASPPPSAHFDKTVVCCI